MFAPVAIATALGAFIGFECERVNPAVSALMGSLRGYRRRVGTGMTAMSIETAALAWILPRFGQRLESSKGVTTGDDSAR